MFLSFLVGTKREGDEEESNYEPVIMNVYLFLESVSCCHSVASSSIAQCKLDANVATFRVAMSLHGGSIL